MTPYLIRATIAFTVYAIVCCLIILAGHYAGVW